MTANWPRTLGAQLLRALHSTEVHQPAGDLAGQLRCSRDQIESALRELREAGFSLDERPGLGVRLVNAPDRIITEDLYARLEDSPLAGEILVFEETESTNNVAQRLGREGRVGPMIIFAERQTAGRGRFGRKWESADHAGLWFSLLLRPELPLPQWARLTTWAGVAVARALEPFVGESVQLKWPNDVQVHGRKVCGVLIESATDRHDRPFAVVGIGINVNQEQFPPELAQIAGSVRQFAGRSLDRAAVAASVLTELGRAWPLLMADFSELVGAAARRSSLIGKWITLAAGATEIQGLAEGLDPDGQLLVRASDGSLRSMAAGEVTMHLAADPSV